MDQATEITQHVYLGPLGVARQRETLLQLNITAVVCVAAEGRAYFPRDFAYWESSGDPIVEHTCHYHDVVNTLDQVWDFVSSPHFAKSARRARLRALRTWPDPLRRGGDLPGRQNGKHHHRRGLRTDQNET